MHHPDQALANYPQSNRESVLFRRLRQIENLAFEVYLKICTSPSHATFFKTDNDIESFWRKKDHDRYRAWGTRLDLRRIRWRNSRWIESPTPEWGWRGALNRWSGCPGHSLLRKRLVKEPGRRGRYSINDMIYRLKTFARPTHNLMILLAS